jgi:hypothetical protein
LLRRDQRTQGRQGTTQQGEDGNDQGLVVNVQDGVHDIVMEAGLLLDLQDPVQRLQPVSDFVAKQSGEDLGPLSQPDAQEF